MKLYIISGGPATGKTSVINTLFEKGYFVLHEVARRISQSDKRFIGKSIKEVNMKDFQKAIFELQKKQIEEIMAKNKTHEIIFSDRGFGDTITYFKINNIKIPENYIEYAKKFNELNNPIVFILDPLNFYEQDELRQENEQEQKNIHAKIIKTYKELGYKIIFVPFDTIENRVDFILSKIKNNRTQSQHSL